MLLCYSPSHSLLELHQHLNPLLLSRQAILRIHRASSCPRSSPVSPVRATRCSPGRKYWKWHLNILAGGGGKVAMMSSRLSPRS